MNPPWPHVPTPERGIWSHYTWFWKYTHRHFWLAMYVAVKSDIACTAMCLYMSTWPAILFCLILLIRAFA